MARAVPDLADEHQTDMASAAYAMLGAAGYPVSIDPELLSHQAQLSSRAAAIAAQLADADGLDTVTALISPVADPGHGTLAEAAHLLRAAGHWLRTASACTYRDDLANKVNQAVDAVGRAQSAVDGVVASFEWVPPQMRGRASSTGPSPVPVSPQATAALARSPGTTDRPTLDKPSPTPPPPTVAQPAPRR